MSNQWAYYFLSFTSIEDAKEPQNVVEWILEAKEISKYFFRFLFKITIVCLGGDDDIM